MPKIDVTPSSAAPGEDVRIAGSGFDIAEKFMLTTVDSTGFESGFYPDQHPSNINRPAPDGTFVVGIKVPPKKGSATIRAYVGNAVVASDTVTVEEEDPEPPPPPPPPTAGDGLIIDPDALKALPTSGSAWSAIVSAANRSGTYTLASQDSPSNITCLARALVAARNNDAAMRAKVIADLKAVKGTKPDRTLALARELGVAPIAADLVGATDAELGYDFKAWLRTIISTTFDGKTLVSMTAERPNNWGTHGQGALAAVYAYLGDKAKLDELHKLVCGWLGDRAQYAGFSWGDTSWQSDPSKPVGINPKGATIQGHNVDGVLPDDQRRGGGFTWPPSGENYVYEALQGTVLAGLVLERTGRAVWAKSDGAVLRAYRWNIEQASFPPSSDDTFITPVINFAYGTNYAVSSPVGEGKNFAFTDWLYS